jgi:recombination protein RecR
MNSIDRLAELFKHFPGIGPRQARRFVYYLLSRNGGYAEELTRAIADLKAEIRQCAECRRFFHSPARASNLCAICADETRDRSLLMLVPRDVDLEAVEKSHAYEGRYFVLGGVVPILEKEPETRIRLAELEARLKDPALKEVILAMNANQDGEHTAEFIKERFKDLNIQFSELGRGLSTGAELEYADPETLKNALLHRTR